MIVFMLGDLSRVSSHINVPHFLNCYIVRVMVEFHVIVKGDQARWHLLATVWAEDNVHVRPPLRLMRV